MKEATVAAAENAHAQEAVLEIERAGPSAVEIVADEGINEHHDLLAAKAHEATSKRTANFPD